MKIIHIQFKEEQNIILNNRQCCHFQFGISTLPHLNSVFYWYTEYALNMNWNCMVPILLYREHNYSYIELVQWQATTSLIYSSKLSPLQSFRLGFILRLLYYDNTTECINNALVNDSCFPSCFPIFPITDRKKYFEWKF